MAEEGLGGDPELEAMARQDQGTQEEASDEDDWTPKDAKELAKKEKQMAKRGITFQSKVGPAAKVYLAESSFTTSKFSSCTKLLKWTSMHAHKSQQR